MLHDILALTIDDLEAWIKKKVPKRTGKLRDSLIKNLHSSSVIGGILKLMMGTKVKYAEDVNDYTTQQVRHRNTKREHHWAYYDTKSGRKRYHPKAYAYYYGYHGEITLNDPEAIGHFWDFMRVYARTRILYNMAKVKKKYLAQGTVLKSSDLAEVKKK